MISMPATIVLILCKTVLVHGAAPDANAAFTGWQDREWATEHAMMVCTRQEVQMTDQAADSGQADPQPFNETRCERSGMMLGSGWDAGHSNSAYRFWRFACPVPIINHEPDGHEHIVGYKLPECGHADTVTCLVDSQI
jgi:hypothetical protein